MTAPGRPYAEVIGDPIAQSKSPLIHGFWIAELGLAADYRRVRIVKGGLDSYLAGRRADPLWRGCNVTMPLKLEALAAADEASDTAVAAGAANLLLPREGRLVADNTDVAAIATLVRRQVGDGSLNVVLLGNGGAARAALVALRLLGIRSVTIHARDLGAARRLALQFGLEFAPRSLDSPVAGDGLINATPLGMGDNPPPPVDLSMMPKGGWLFDMVTFPADTALLRSARERGLATITGLQMLVEQAADSFGPLFGAEPPRQRDAELIERLKS